jgi:hypothetical protein
MRGSRVYSAGSPELCSVMCEVLKGTVTSPALQPQQIFSPILSFHSFVLLYSVYFLCGSYTEWRSGRHAVAGAAVVGRLCVPSTGMTLFNHRYASQAPASIRPLRLRQPSNPSRCQLCFVCSLHLGGMRVGMPRLVQLWCT